MKEGDRVYHNGFGWGIVKGPLPTENDTFVHIDFKYVVTSVKIIDCMDSSGKPLRGPGKSVSNEELPHETLQELSRNQHQEVLPSNINIDKNSRAPIDGEEVEARRGITALRLGQVLESQIFGLSVATEGLMATFRDVVNKVKQGSPVILLIEGAWGGGKTHALTLLQAHATRSRFVTASALMDGSTISLGDPMSLMEAIVGSFRFPETSGLDSITHFLASVMREGKLGQLKARGANLIARALEVIPSDAFDDPDVRRTLEDYFALSTSQSAIKARLTGLGRSSIILPKLKANRIAERPDAFRDLLMEWAQFAVVMKNNGLLVVLDELDVEYGSTVWKNQRSWLRRERRTNVLRALSGISKRKTPLGVPLAIAFASVNDGGSLSSEHDAVEHILSVLGSDIVHVTVPTPGRQEYEQLFLRLADLYCKAYPNSAFQLSERQSGHLFKALIMRHLRKPGAVPRQFVRSTLEVFDLLSLSRGNSYEKLVEMLERG